MSRFPASLVFLALCVGAVLAQTPTDVTQYDAANREYICKQNVDYCANACLQSAALNTCDPVSMTFDCVCRTGPGMNEELGIPLPSSSVPNISPHYFPVNSAQCLLENNACYNPCITPGATGDQINACKFACDAKFACGTPNAGEKINYWVGSKGQPTTSTGSGSGSGSDSSSTTNTNRTRSNFVSAAVPVSSSSSSFPVVFLIAMSCFLLF